MLLDLKCAFENVSIAKLCVVYKQRESSTKNGIKIIKITII